MGPYRDITRAGPCLGLLYGTVPYSAREGQQVGRYLGRCPKQLPSQAMYGTVPNKVYGRWELLRT